jgi:PhoPQ-activated pathogenicity-related protein
MEKEKDFKYADEGIEYLKKNNQFVEENINEIIYDRLFKRCRSINDINEYRKTRNFI